MLIGITKGWTRTEVFYNGDVPVGEIRLAEDWEAGEIEVGQHVYRVHRRGRRRLVNRAGAFRGGPFILELDGEQKAQAEVTRRFVHPERTVTCGGRTYVLRMQSAACVLVENGEVTGTILHRRIRAPKPPARLLVRIIRWFRQSKDTYERVVDFPAEVPPPAQLFMVWLVKIRERNIAASSQYAVSPPSTKMPWAAALGRRKAT